MKIRTGFVSNSSSSSFIAKFSDKGCFHAEGMGEALGCVGYGYSFPLKDEHYEQLEDGSTDNFCVEIDGECGVVGIVRPITAMKSEQTLDDFLAETKALFTKEFGEVFKPKKKPELFAVGSVGNGG